MMTSIPKYITDEIGDAEVDRAFDAANSDLLALIPQEQLDHVMSGPMVDIGREFLGFVDIYKNLAAIIPKHFTVIDLGCAFAPQSFFFAGHRKYIGVDNMLSVDERFHAGNTEHYDMTIGAFLIEHGCRFNMETTFAICSYVPPWYEDNMKMVRGSFKNVFTYYPGHYEVKR